MLIGMGKGARKNTQSPAAAPQQQAQAGNDVIFDVGTHDFEARVMAGSTDIPILVQFWAPWCGPCKQLTPVLESLVRAASGKIAMARVNIDDHPELAQALRVQTVPMVFAFFQGQPVTGFNGVRPQSELQKLIDQLIQLAQNSRPDAIDIPEALSKAAEAMAAGDLQTAQGLYFTILQQEEHNAQAFAGLARTLIAAGETAQAAEMIANAPDQIANDPNIQAAKTALELAENRPDAAQLPALEQRLAQNPDDHEARFELALALFSTGQSQAAIEALLEIIRRDRAWEDEKARTQLLKFFEALGPSDPATMAGRRKLSSLLFS